MPRSNKKVSKARSDSKKRKFSEENWEHLVTNVNSNHSSESFSTRQAETERSFRSRETKHPKVKSKVVKPSEDYDQTDTRVVIIEQQLDPGQSNIGPVQFEEEGEIVEMEIDDGGEAARQFGSDDEEETECCDMGQNDTIGKIELIPFSVLSTDNTNC